MDMMEKIQRSDQGPLLRYFVVAALADLYNALILCQYNWHDIWDTYEFVFSYYLAEIDSACIQRGIPK